MGSENKLQSKEWPLELERRGEAKKKGVGKGEACSIERVALGSQS